VTSGVSLTNATYNIAGQLTGDRIIGNGVIDESFGYDSQHMQLISQTASGPTSMSLTYSYQAQAGQMGANTMAGNVGQLTSVSGTIAGQAESASYTYDLSRRLVTSSQTTNGVSAQRRFVYDRFGNRTAVWDAVSGGNKIQSAVLQQSGGAPTNRIQSVTNSGVTTACMYDAAGNVTGDGLHSYGYDAENRLVSVDLGDYCAVQLRLSEQAGEEGRRRDQHTLRMGRRAAR
jgi:hypothetical protein